MSSQDRRWLALALFLVGAVAAADVVFGTDVVLLGLQALPPLVACLRAGPRATVAVAVAALVAAVTLGLPNDIFGSLDHIIRVVNVSVAGSLAIAIAALRGQRRMASLEAGARAAILDSALDGLISIDHDGRVLEWNHAAEEIFGYSSAEALGGELVDLVIPEGLRERHQAGLARQRAGGASRILDRRIELTALRSDGSEFPVELTVTRVRNSEPAVYMAFVRDITERKRFEQRLAHQAMHDALTGLPNRALLLDRLSVAVRRLRRSGAVTAVLFIDFDRFKAVNDSLGHAAGDEALTTAVRRFRSVLRPEDTLARISGDEFCAVCEGLVDETQAALIASRLTQALARPMTIGGTRVVVTASVGVVTAAREGETAEGLLSAADTAMYRAKETGKSRFVVFDERMRSSAGERVQLEAELREAIERRELVVHYQPQIDLRNGRTVGVEALARWQHPRRGLLGPSEFMEAAEDTGLIVPLGVQVLEQVCRDARRWKARLGDGVNTISVNLSAAQLASPDLARSVEAALAASGVKAHSLCLEITESTLMDSAASTSGALTTLQRLGVRLAIDDFGTGYSSLGYLRRLPVDQLKVDRSFIEGLGARDDDRAIVSAVVSMGHSLGLSVLAEGVETEQQLRELRELGCDLGQGFHFARPGPVKDEPPFADQGFELKAV